MSNDPYETFAAVDRYVEELFGPSDPVLEAAMERADAAGLPAIQVSASLGRFLQVLALACGARSVLEIGTLAGYSAIWLAAYYEAAIRLSRPGTVIVADNVVRGGEVAREQPDDDPARNI